MDIKKRAQTILEEAGLETTIEKIELLTGGNAHQNIHLTTPNQDLLIRRIKTEDKDPSFRRDTYFGGNRTLDREYLALNTLNANRVPAPTPIALTIEEPALIVTHTPGITPYEFLEQHEHKKTAHHQLLKHLAVELAKVHQVTFEQYGTPRTTGVLPGFNTYPEYLEHLIERHHNEAIDTYFTLEEQARIFVRTEELIGEIEETEQPCLVIYDLHPKNYFVDATTGKPTSFFDVEFIQSAHPNLELSGLAHQLFSFYSHKDEKKAREAFLQTYYLNGGRPDSENHPLEQIHTMNHFLSAIRTQHERKKRPGWPEGFKAFVMDITDNGRIDYDHFRRLVRRDLFQHPEHPQ